VSRFVVHSQLYPACKKGAKQGFLFCMDAAQIILSRMKGKICKANRFVLHGCSANHFVTHERRNLQSKSFCAAWMQRNLICYA